MKLLQDTPIKRKVTLVVLLTCSLALFLACAILAAYQMFQFRRTMVRDTTVLADVLSENTEAALAFQDESDATNKLSTLEAEPNVVGACLYSHDGKIFADYRRGKDTSLALPPSPPKDGSHFQSDSLEVVRPVMLKEKRVGTILVRTDLQGMYARLKLFAVVAVLVLLGSCAVALALAAPLQRAISRPIIALTEAANLIAEHKDYSIRLPDQGRDETGLLTAAFSQLMASIEERDKKLSAQLARLALLHQITRATGERLDLNSVFQVVVRTVEEQLPVDFCCICVLDVESKMLTVATAGGRSQEFAAALDMSRHEQIPADGNGLGRCISGQLVYEPDVGVSTHPFSQRLIKAGLRAFVAAPMLVESSVVGVLLAARRASESFSSGECEFLRQLSEHVALSAHQARLHSALQRAYDDLRQTQQAVMQQERLRALGQMASGIAHDINNAISPVGLYTESLLEQEPNLSPRAREYLETIQRSIEDVSQTLARMREFYRQRETPLALLPVELNPLLQHVVDLSRARWSDLPQQRGVYIEMTLELAAGLPPILGVESEIREALVNLVFNAVDAMPEGGRLTLRTRALTRSDVAGHEVPWAAVEIVDTGMGMDEETRRRCMEPFFTTKGERGTGLGLAMVYGIAQRHGADMEIESEKGKGTIVRLTFPAAAAQPAAPAAAAPAGPQARLRILVIDDDPLLIKSLRDTLETDGHRVVTANGGQAGIEAFRAALAGSEVFSVVITDLGMPYVDGRKVAGAIKAASPSTPIILLTGWGQRLVAEGDIPPHVDKVLNKPPKLRELRQALALLCAPPAPVTP